MPPRSLYLIVSLGVLALATGCSDEETFPRESFYQVHGVVRDSATLAPLAGTELLYREDVGDSFHHITSSDTSGSYVFERGFGVPPGSLRFVRPGYVSREYDVAAQAVPEADDRWRLDAFLADTSAAVSPRAQASW